MTEIDDICKAAILRLQESCTKRHLSLDVLCERLRLGCSLFAALNIPSTWTIVTVTDDGDNTYYKIEEHFPAVIHTFDGIESDLQEFIEEKKKQGYIK